MHLLKGLSLTLINAFPFVLNLCWILLCCFRDMSVFVFLHLILSSPALQTALFPPFVFM